MGRDEDDPDYVGAPADHFERVTTHIDLTKPDHFHASILAEVSRANKLVIPSAAPDLSTFEEEPRWGSGRFVSEREKLAARSPAAAEFYAVLREKDLLYPDDMSEATKFAEPRIRRRDPEPERAPATLVEDLQPRTLLRSEMEQISRNIAHAMGLLAGAWLAECPLPHAALRNAGLLNEYPRNNGGRAVQASEARVKAQVESANRRSAAIDYLASIATKYVKEDLLGDPTVVESFKPRTDAFRSELQGKWVSREPQGEISSLHLHRYSADLTVIDDPLPRTLAEERAERIADLDATKERDLHARKLLRKWGL